MATFTVAAGTDWLATTLVGAPGDRWRLDDYDIAAHLKRPGDDSVLLELTLANGRLIISDAPGRRLEFNIGWELIEPLLPGDFIFDLLFENRSTEVRSRSERHELVITSGITADLTVGP